MRTMWRRNTIQSLPFQVYQSMCRTSMTSNTIHKYRTETSSQMDMTSCSHINMCSQNIPQHIIIIPPPLNHIQRHTKNQRHTNQNLILHQNHTNQKSHTSRRNTKRKNLTNLKNLTKKEEPEPYKPSDPYKADPVKGRTLQTSRILQKKKNLNHTNPVTHIKQTQ